MNSLNFDDLRLYSNVLKTIVVDTENYYYIPYLISSPEYLHKENKKNDAYLPLYILVLNKKDFNIFYFEKTYINWHSIHYYETFTYIQKDYTAKRIEQIPKYDKYFKDIELIINPNNVNLITLNDVIKRGFYKNLDSIIDEKLENEVFIEFISDNRTYIISGIELVRYFYAKAEEDSLLNVLFHPEGINLLYNDLTTSTTEYKLYLKNHCSKVDSIHALYFIHEDKFSEWFNEILLRMRSTKYLYAFFPSFSSFKIKCRAFLHKNNSLIIKIFDSDIHDKLSDKKIIITHPNDKDVDRRGYTKRNTRPIKINGEPSNDFDDDISSIIGADDFMITENESSSLTKKELVVEFEKDKTDKKPPSNKMLYINSKGTKLTPNDGKGKRKEGKKTQLYTFLYPDKFDEVNSIDYFNSIDKIIQIFKDEYSYSVNIKSFYFPDKKMPNNKTKTVAISFIDKDKLKRRKYILVRFESKIGESFFYLDVEENELKHKKEILIIKNNLPILDFQKRYVTKLIYDQVRDGNHKWLSNYQHGLSTTQYKTFGHSYHNIKDLCKAINLFIV